MRVYLAGPMSGIPQFNFPEFYRVTKLLRERHRLEVFSPAELDAQHGVDGRQVANAQTGPLDALQEKQPVGEVGVDQHIEVRELH